MPEEKVSRYDRDEVKRLEREIELTGDNRFVGMPPAADAGPRPSDTCGEPAASFIPRWGMYFTCVLPKGHEGEHKQGGTCFKHGEYVGEKCPKWPDCSSPVPQEAASVTIPSSNDDPAITQAVRKVVEDYGGTLQMLGNSGQAATAPDWAMRVARQVTERLKGIAHEAGNYDGNPKPHCDQCAHDEAAILDAAEALEPHSAALICQAGSERERRLTSVLFVIMSDMPKKRDWLDPDIEREASRLLGESK